METSGSDERTVEATVELVGEYDEIASILGRSPDSSPDLDPVAEDMQAVLEIVERAEGATKSQITEDLPSTVTADLDTEAIIHVLRVLELYDLVTLDGNTWRPGPSLRTD